MLHDFKLLRSTISELITSLHSHKTAKTNSTNNCSIFATSTESTIECDKKTNSLSLLRQSISPSPHYTLLYSTKKNLVALYINRKNNPENSRTKSREKEKKALLALSVVFKLCVATPGRVVSISQKRHGIIWFCAIKSRFYCL